MAAMIGEGINVNKWQVCGKGGGCGYLEGPWESDWCGYLAGSWGSDFCGKVRGSIDHKAS
jgi:hypothetical protein